MIYTSQMNSMAFNKLPLSLPEVLCNSLQKDTIKFSGSLRNAALLLLCAVAVSNIHFSLEILHTLTGKLLNGLEIFP
jgi:hypothetical protein